MYAMICSARFIFSGVKEKGVFGLFSGESRCFDELDCLGSYHKQCVTLTSECSMDWSDGEAATGFQRQLASSSQQASPEERHDDVRCGCALEVKMKRGYLKKEGGKEVSGGFRARPKSGDEEKGRARVSVTAAGLPPGSTVDFTF
jgi:hypothetical protein